MRKKKNLLNSTFMAMSLTAALAMPMATSAEEINLKSQDGTIDITGEFLDFYDNIYLVRTPLGVFRLSAKRVRCEGSACPVFEDENADVIFAGSDTVGTGIMPLILEGFAGYKDANATLVATSRPNEVIANLVGDGGFGEDIGSYLLSSTSSKDAFDALLEGKAEVGMSARRILPNEARALRAAGAGNMVSLEQEHIIAIDSIVAIVHPDNPVKSLSMDQLADIYAGKIKNWSEVGGPDVPVKVIDRPAGSGTQTVFASRVLHNKGVSPTAVIAEDNTDTANLVSADLGAIGYTGFAFKRGNKPLTLVNECGIPMIPDAFSARTEEYALQRRLYLYNRADAKSDATKDLLEYALSESADAVIAKAGFIDLGVDRRTQSKDSARAKQLLNPDANAYEATYMREMLNQMIDYDRLSTTFRFRTGSSKLDERGQVDLERLTDYLETQPAGTRVVFAGFTDSVGAFDSNKTLAENRARQVKAELEKFAGNRIDNLQIDVAAYGEIAPSACNVSDRGRSINRRVEVWIGSPQQTASVQSDILD